MSAPPQRRPRARTGTTLVELLVVLAVLGVMASVAGLAFGRGRAAPTQADSTLARIAGARREAIVTGRDVSLTVMLDSAPRAVTAHADGSVRADSLPALDPLSGRVILERPADAPR